MSNCKGHWEEIRLLSSFDGLRGNLLMNFSFHYVSPFFLQLPHFNIHLNNTNESVHSCVESNKSYIKAMEIIPDGICKPRMITECTFTPIFPLWSGNPC